MAGQPPSEAVQSTATSPTASEFVVPLEQWDRFVDPIAMTFLRDSLRCVAKATGVPNPLIPLTTTADGNCLAHSASLATNGNEHQSGFIRGQVYRELANHRSWYLEQLPHVTQEMFDDELEAAGVDERFMDVGTGLHLLALANVLKRPVLLMASQQHMQDTTMSNCGTYLPLRIPHTNVNSKIPIIIAWQRPDFTNGAGHFVCVAPTSAGNATLPASWLPGAVPPIDDGDSTTFGNYLAMSAGGSLVLREPVTPRPMELTSIRQGKKTGEIVARYEYELCNFIFTCCADRLFRAIMLAFDFGIRFEGHKVSDLTTGLAEVNQCGNDGEVDRAIWRIRAVAIVINKVKEDTSLATGTLTQQMLEYMSDGYHNHPGCAPKHTEHFGNCFLAAASPKHAAIRREEAIARALTWTSPVEHTHTQALYKEYMRAETEWMRWIQSHPTCPDPQSWRSSWRADPDALSVSCRENAWNQVLWVGKENGSVHAPEKMRRLLHAWQNWPERTVSRDVFPSVFTENRIKIFQNIQSSIQVARAHVAAASSCAGTLAAQEFAAAVKSFDKAIALDPSNAATNELLSLYHLTAIQTERDAAMTKRVHAEAEAAGLAIGARTLMRTGWGVADVYVNRYNGEQVIVVTEQGRPLILGDTVLEARMEADEATRIEAKRLHRAGRAQMDAGEYEHAYNSLDAALKLLPNDLELAHSHAHAYEEMKIQQLEGLAKATGLVVGAQLWVNLHGPAKPTEVTVHNVDPRGDRCYLRKVGIEKELHRWLSLSEAVSLVCEMIECPIIMCPYPVELCWRHDGCRWASIEACSHGLESAIKDRQVPTCPVCDYTLNEGDVWKILDNEEPRKKISLVAAFHEVKAERFFDDKHRCPVMHGDEQCRGCIVIDPDDTQRRMLCEVCDMDSCVQCKQHPYHHGCECEELKSLTSTWHAWCQMERSKYLRKVGIEDKRFQRSQEKFRERQAEIDRLQGIHRQNLADEKWKEKKCRRCPHCKRPVEKIDGCV